MRYRSIRWLAAAALLCTSCTLLSEDASVSDATVESGGADAGAADGGGASTGSGGSEPTQAATPTLRPVELPAQVQSASFTPLEFERVEGDDRVATAIAISKDTYETASTVVLARSDEFADALAAAPLAVQLQAPVLLTDPDALDPAVVAELDRLGATDVVILGAEAAVSDQVAADLETGGRTVDRIAGADRYETAAQIAARVEPSGRVYVATGADFPDALSAGAAAGRLPAPLLLVDEEVGAAAERVLTDQRPSEIVVVGGEVAVSPAVVSELEDFGATVTRLAGEDRYATAAEVHNHVVDDFGAVAGIWLASATGFADALAAGPAAANAKATLLLTHPTDASKADATVAVLEQVGGTVTIAGGPAAVTDQTPRQVRAVIAGNLLPGGGTVLFPDNRMVAYYGNAEEAVLGVLGETEPQRAAELTKEVASGFADGERTVLPAFELIVSIALAGAGADGKYSKVGALSDVQEYLDAARANDMYLFLDFQPGRNRFIDQVKLFEKFIREPDVGIALDPEWRVTDTQRPGQLIGSVDAEELNEVIDYAADIVREEDLPQKLVVIHQFRTSMIRDRDTLHTPPELAVTIHVDGFGTQDLKLQTWNALASADAPWWHGFKLFYDEDTNIFQPDQVLDFTDPAVDLITYQ